MIRHLWKVGNFVLAGLVLLSLTACGGESAANFAPSAASTDSRSSPPGGTTGASEYYAAGPTSTTGADFNLAPGGEPARAMMDATPAAGSGSSDSSGARVNTGKTSSSQYQSPLTAGQVDDNAKFDEYLDYLQRSQWVDATRISVEERMFVRVMDGAQKPVAGARVQLFDGDRQVFDGRTVSDGRVLFFPRQAGASNAQNLRAVITRGQVQAEAIVSTDKLEQTIAIKSPDNTGPVGLDIVFLMDATGSMADEIAQLTATVDSIASRIEQLSGSSRPRLGLVAYRDEGDEYVTRSWDFTPDVQQFSANLANVRAENGGDYPEAVTAGLRDAIHLPGWADSSAGRRLRLIILVADAPPHLDYAHHPAYPQLLQEAVGAGIKIFPIGASGLDDQGEYIFRQFAQVTQGQFIFLTYANGVSGAPGPSTTHDVSDFTVRNLDSLVVSLVASEVANQTGAQGSTAPVYVAAGVSAIPSAGLMAGLIGLARGALDQVFNMGLGFWAAVALAGWLWLQRRSQRARVAATPFTLPPSRREEPQDEEQDWGMPGEDDSNWYADAGEPEESIGRSTGSTVQVATTADPYAYGDDEMGQPTTPLRAIPLAYSNLNVERPVEVGHRSKR